MSEPSSTKLLRYRLRVLRVGACMAFAFVGTLVLIADYDIANSIQSLVKFVPGRDKTIHFCLFGGLAVPATILFGWRNNSIRMICVVQAVVFMLGLSTAEEFSQLFLQTRTFDWADLACNYFGIACFGSGTATVMFWARQRIQRDANKIC